MFIENAEYPESFFAKSYKTYSERQIADLIKISDRYSDLSKWKSYKTKYINSLKEKLLNLLSKSIEYNSISENKCIRNLRNDAIIDKNIISVFESSLTRALGIQTNELSTDIFVVKVYYFDIIQDLILNGFEYNGEKYMFLTASAGQIRTKKTVFIKESHWHQYERTLMCGLTVNKINQQGGINVNKYLAYLALSNSATDLWENFDIDRCIVVDDFKTAVHGNVDFIDDKTYLVERRAMDIDIEHTDGCGMILPSISTKNFMIRLPWIKGLLASFDFKRFVDVYKSSPIVKDIYGVEHDIIAEDIQIIFTKSQFKMHKYYTDWQQYKNYFKKYHCQAGTCKREEDYIRNAHINYQMLQTLTDITDKEILKIADKGIDKLRKLTSDINVALDVFGAIPGRVNMNSFQQALTLYPEMLTDSYCKDLLSDLKRSLVRDYRAGKLPVQGKFTFVVPDLFAFCQRLFLHMEDPPGLLDDGEVSCRLYKRAKKLDCLRSPHLYREHAVRKNVLNTELGYWFKTDAVYTSCKDLISKVLQFDNDGDTLLIVADKTIIEVAERNMKGIVPLYYDMKKAEPVILDNKQFYDGMVAAWTGGNIGAISNDITKIWNSGEIGEDELLAVKLLCMENNFVIDFAKTLYRPTRPPHINAFITKYTKSKMPNFFVYAKDYSIEQTVPNNYSFVNKLERIIKNKRLSFKNIADFNYHNLMHNQNVKIDQQLIESYMQFNKSYHYKINSDFNITYISQLIKEELSKYGYSDIEVTDMLVQFLYHEIDSRHKKLLWLCYGDIMLENLQCNLSGMDSYCIRCGIRFKKSNTNHKYCNHCYLEKIKKDDERIIVCKDCGEEFIVSKNVRSKMRCDACQSEYVRKYEREKKRKQRIKRLGA